MTISDVALAPSGELYVLDESGTIKFQSPEIGHGFNHVPASVRPSHIWKTVEPPPSRPRKIFAAHGGKLMALTETGVLYERVSSRDARLFPVFIWRALTTGEEA